MAFRISKDSTREEPARDAEHFHVWRQHGKATFRQPPRFGTKQAARQHAKRCGLAPGTFSVKKCPQPCAIEVKRKRRKRKPCRHCGRLP